MRMLRLWTLLLVPMLSAQAFAQIDTSAMEVDSLDAEYVQEKETEDNALRVQVKGFLDTYHAVRTEGRADWIASRTRARGELTLEKGAASLFLSLNATYNGLLKDRTGLELREAYLAYAKGNLDLRMERQIVVWGVADALRLTDCVSPCDYTEFLAQDYDDIRMPVNALRAKYTWRSVTFETIDIPVADFFVLPSDRRNPWALSLSLAALPYTLDMESGRPEKRLRNMEYGGRITVNLSGIDFSLSALRTWNKMPALSLALSEDGKQLLVKGEYRHMTILGADCSLPVGQFVLRTEAACYFGEAQSGAVGKDVVCRNTYNALVGVDWYPGNDWNFSA